MTAKKYQFYLDTKKQEDFHTIKYTAKKVDDGLINAYHKNNPAADRLMILVTEHTLNSANPFVQTFFKDNTIDNQILSRIIRKYETVKITIFDCVDIDLLPKETNVINIEDALGRKTLLDVKNSSYPQFVKVLDLKTLNFYRLFVNHNENIVISDFLIKDIELDIKYKIYVNDRLLIERFFPYNLPLNKVLCEECYLELSQKIKFRVESDYGLIFKQVSVNDTNFYPNSTELILEP